MHVIGPDTIVDGRYRAERRLGSGGMAEVWCVEDEVLGRRVALKLLGGRYIEDPDFRERFRREAQSAASLAHPNIVGVFDRGEWDGTPYIAMELVDGRTLKQLVQQRGPLDIGTAVNLTEQVLSALGYAHRRGIVHRDIKPQNVIVDGEGVAKVADFGIARAANSEMTETGAIVGTVQYLSPEQAQGQPVDRRSDLYSVGVVLYELLTGQVPFDGEAAVSIALKHVSEPPVPPGQLRPGLPPALEAVVMRALEKDPLRRFQTAEEFSAALETTRRAPGRPVVVEPALDEPRGSRWWVWALALLAVVAIVIGAFALLGGERVKVPDVVGKEATEAADILHDEGLEVEFIPEVDEDTPRDEVIREEPAPGETVREGTTINVTISSGPGEAPVPDVVGKSREDAEDEVRDAGFQPRVAEAFSDDVPEGDVIKSSPQAGQALQRGRTVTLTVSQGVEGIEVPKVVGLQSDQAQSQLADAGLKPDVTEEETTQPAGTVMTQDPPAGTRVDKGATVKLTVAKERPEVPDVTTGNPTVEEATATLEKAGFKVKTKDREGDPTLVGRVVDQSPDAGESRSTGATITISVGTAGEPAADADGDGVPDAEEEGADADADGDGIPDAEEGATP